MLLHVCTFFTFFLTQVFAPFHICASLFSASFFSFFPFFIALSLYPIFTRTLVIALNIFLPRASIYATIRLSLSVFIRLNPCATPGFLRLTYTRLQKRWHLISLIHERQDPSPLWEMFAQIHNQWFTYLIIHGKSFLMIKRFLPGKFG